MQTIDVSRLHLTAEHWVLDLGCGQGRHSHAVSLLTAAQVIALDIDWSDVHQAVTSLSAVANAEQTTRCHGLAGDGLALPFGDNCFDAIICSEVLEHVPDYQTILTEIKRVLKPQGQLAVSVPRAWPEKICWRLSTAYHQVKGGHIRIFNATALKQTIEQQAFDYLGRHWAHALHVPYWWLRCAFWRKDEQFALVRWYHKLLVWDLMQKPKLTRAIERVLNPIMGKSIVMYFKKGKEVI